MVESERHRGTCSKTASWLHAGKTIGRAKKSTVHHPIIPIMEILHHPLRNDYADVQCE